MVPEFKKLGELVAADPKLKNRVVIAKVRCSLCMLPCHASHCKSASSVYLRLGLSAVQLVPYPGRSAPLPDPRMPNLYVANR
jgi:hypothetical protein